MLSIKSIVKISESGTFGRFQPRRQILVSVKKTNNHYNIRSFIFINIIYTEIIFKRIHTELEIILLTTRFKENILSPLCII